MVIIQPLSSQGYVCFVLTTVDYLCVFIVFRLVGIGVITFMLWLPMCFTGRIAVVVFGCLSLWCLGPRYGLSSTCSTVSATDRGCISRLSTYTITSPTLYVR